MSWIILQDENRNVTGKKKLSETSTTPQSKQQKAQFQVTNLATNTNHRRNGRKKKKKKKKVKYIQVNAKF